MAFTQEQIDLFDLIIRNLSLAIKNSALYDMSHSICVASIKNFKECLDKWVVDEGKLEIGITHDDIFLDGSPVKEEKDARYTELADYLHMRGIISLNFIKGISEKELSDFFSYIKKDRRIIRKEGGVLENMPETPNLQVKEIDYSALLDSTKGAPVTEEAEVWQSLFKVAEESREGKLPEGKSEFLEGFLEDGKKSANMLNKVYHEAVEKLQDEETLEEIRDTVAKICVYFEKYDTPHSKALKVKLMNIVSQLHPDLIGMLFEKTVVDERDFNLANEITKDLSDSFVAEFIESLISSDDTFNENLLKVFEKLAPGKSRASNVVSMVADKLFSKRVLNPEVLTQMQTSIKEIFKNHTDSDFMSQLHKITVDAVINKKMDTLVYVAKLSPMINKFVQSIEEGRLKKEEIWLLLNILWLEESPEEFKKFGEKLLEILPELLDGKETVRLKEMVEFFTEKMRPEQKENEQIAEEAKALMNKIMSKESRDEIISYVPDADSKELDDIAYMLSKSEESSAGMLINGFISEKNPAYRNKFRTIFSTMKEEIVKETIDRMEYCDPSVVRDLFSILAEYSPDKAHLIAKKLMRHENARMRWEGLDVFKPVSDDEINSVFELFKKERNEEVKKKAASVLLETRNPEVIDELFKCAEGRFFISKFFITLVELCGNMRVQESFSNLKRLFLKRPFFTTKNRNNLRVASISSLARLHTEEAMELVRQGFKDKSETVRKMCEIILRLDGKGELLTKEVDENAGE
ncbi:MAG: hypothetical protein WBB86_07740 [Candidatus Omnitrophota bacterium]